MKKALLTSAFALGVLMAPMAALAEGAILWSNEKLPGYTWDSDTET